MFDHIYDDKTNTLSFIFSGHMDSAHSTSVAPVIEKEVNEHAAAPAQDGQPFKVIFDLKEVDFISSAFIRICLMVVAKIKAGNLQIQNASPLIKKTIKISGLDNQLMVT
jgi:anti-anti-sigma factor